MWCTIAKILAEKDRLVTSMQGQEAWVEHFDAPIVARHVRLSEREGCGVIDGPYHSTMEFSLASLCVDEWDRFHGLTDQQIPFVFSRSAQIEFFELLESFDDESVTVHGQRYATPAWLAPANEVNTSPFWTNIYTTEEPRWELGRENPILLSILPQLKLNKSRVLVLGCGSANDAAHFAQQGHMVTAVDFSAEAIQRAKAKYGGIENLTLVQADVFQLPTKMNSAFDLVFEHTLYCAISPDRRSDMVKVWKSCLGPQGNLLGIFFVNEKRQGPPFGGSEWEVRERLKGSFDFLYWTRWRHSIDRRKSQELVVYAKLKT